jgi:hypothetical protein
MGVGCLTTDMPYNWHASQPVSLIRHKRLFRQSIYTAPLTKKFTHNDIMFLGSINPIINGGIFQVYHLGATIGTSEAN